MGRIPIAVVPPLRSEKPISASSQELVPNATLSVLLVQLLQVWSAVSVKARPSRLRAGQHFVFVAARARTFGIFAQAGNDLAFFGKRGHFVQVASEARELDRVAVKIGKIVGDHIALGVVPGAGPDSVARIHRGLAVFWTGC